MSNSVELREWETEPDIHSFEVSAPSWVRVKSHHGKRIDKKWLKRYGYELREVTVHCVVSRHPDMKHLCGYVGFPKIHQLYKADGWIMDHVEVHGGITFSNFWKKREGFNPKFWYIGFDAGHYMDCVPTLEKTLASIPELRTENIFGHLMTFDVSKSWKDMNTIYRNMAYMTDETTLLAKQLLFPHPIEPKGRERWINGLRLGISELRTQQALLQ